MSERERVENHNDEMLMNEAVMDRQKRWLRRIDAMDDEERQTLYKEYSIGGTK